MRKKIFLFIMAAIMAAQIGICAYIANAAYNVYAACKTYRADFAYESRNDYRGDIFIRLVAGAPYKKQIKCVEENRRGDVEFLQLPSYVVYVKPGAEKDGRLMITEYCEKKPRLSTSMPSLYLTSYNGKKNSLIFTSENLTFNVSKKVLVKFLKRLIEHTNNIKAGKGYGGKTYAVVALSKTGRWSLRDIVVNGESMSEAERLW